MSFINANTANPTNSSQIGYQQQTQFFNSGLVSGGYDIGAASSTLTQGVWLINACVYMQPSSSSAIMNFASLNIIYSTSPISITSTYATESAVTYFSGSVGLQQVALNTMTVLYVGTTPYYYGALVYATTTAGTWNILNGGKQCSVIRATKIA